MRSTCSTSTPARSANRTASPRPSPPARKDRRAFSFQESLQVTERTIYRLADAEGIPAFKVGGSWRFHRGDLDQWIAGRVGTTGTSPETGDEMSTSALHPRMEQSPLALPTCKGTKSLRSHNLRDAFGMREGSE